MKIVVHTLGCKVNEYESNSIVKELIKAGHEVSENPHDVADVYILNTCAVTNEAEKKSRQAVSKMVKTNPKAKVIVCGCASQNNANQFEEKENVTLVMGSTGKYLIPSLIEEVGNYTLPLTEDYEDEFEPEVTKTRAYLKVQDGCNNFCNYCIIPYVRGRSRSRSLDSITIEAAKLATQTDEIVLTGIDLSDYRINGELALTDLLSALKNIPARIRISSLNVSVITEEFLKVVSSMENFCPHFHLSMQSGCDKTLKDMNRKYTSKEYLEKVELIRKYFDSPAITTDVILGYIGETEEDFRETCVTVLKAKFYEIHIFRYSQRAGTVADRLEKDKKLLPVDSETVKKRMKAMQIINDKLREEYVKSQTGKLNNVIFEKVVTLDGEDYLVGHSANYLKCYKKASENSGVYLHQLNGIEFMKPFKDGILVKFITE